MADQIHIEAPQTKEAVVEPSEKRAQESDGIFRLMPGRYRLEQAGAEDRRQDQRHEHRQEHGGDDGHGELAVDDAGGTGEERHGAEHGREHEPDADQRARDLLHGLGRGLPGGQSLLGHDPLHVFHDHDGVVHEQSDGKNHGKHREHVDGETENSQNGKCSQEDDRHGNRGNQRGPNVPEKEPHDQEDQQDRFEERFHHLFDGDPNEGSGVIGIDVLHSRGKVPAQLRHLRLDGIGRVEGVGARRLADRDGAGRSPVVGGFNIVQLGSQLGPAHIPDPHGGAVRVGADGDGGKFLRCPEQVLDDNGRIQALALYRRHSAELSRGDLHIVSL